MHTKSNIILKAFYTCPLKGGGSDRQVLLLVILVCVHGAAPFSYQKYEK